MTADEKGVDIVIEHNPMNRTTDDSRKKLDAVGNGRRNISRYLYVQVPGCFKM